MPMSQSDSFGLDSTAQLSWIFWKTLSAVTNDCDLQLDVFNCVRLTHCQSVAVIAHNLNYNKTAKRHQARGEKK